MSNMSKTPHWNPAATVIERAGGARAVSKITGADYSRVCRWRAPKGELGGTGGVVPHDSAIKLIFWAKKRKKRGLGPAAFMKLPTRAA